ncbi:MAG: response regulator [Desulfobulbus sp.]|jgi:PAS domain S-box-containing protein|nr:response regulator [Desulfobulbus sp.]
MMAHETDVMKTMLIVDDDAAVRELLSAILQECGYSCLAVEDVPAARQALREIPVDLVLTDRDMPGESGIDLIRSIKELYPEIGVIMVTVIDDIDQAREVLDLGVYGYITKPFTHNQVLITVENALRHRQIELQNRHYATFLQQEVNERTETLQDQLNLLQTLVDTIPAPVFYKDSQGIYLGCNQAFEEAVNLPREAIFGRTTADVLEPGIAAETLQEEQELLATGGMHRVERTFFHPDGSHRHGITHKATFTGSAGQIAGLVGVHFDVTELKSIEQSLRVSEKTLRTIMDNLHVGVLMFNPCLEPIQLNRQMRCWFPNIQEGMPSPELRDLLGRMGASTANISTDSPTYSSGPDEGPVSLATVKGNRLFKVILSTVQDTNAQSVTTIGLFEDVTDALTAERELRQAQKLESIGHLAAGIAHEINTPIQFIGDNVQFIGEAMADLTAILEKGEILLRTLQNGQPVDNLVQQMELARDTIDMPFLIREIPEAISQTLVGVDRVATIIYALREFSHPGSEGKTAVDINQALENTITVSRNEWKYVAEMTTLLADDLPMLCCLPGELNQAFLNILVNAAHAIAEATDNGRLGKGLITVSTKVDQPMLEIRISDTGNGIPQDIQERVFDPFFTTKEVGKGTGQGLAIARSVVVDKHQGTIRFISEPGRGTTFIIRLPLQIDSSTTEDDAAIQLK